MTDSIQYPIPLPANYRPTYIEVLFDGQQAYCIDADGEVHLNPEWQGEPNSEPETLEMFWDDRYVYGQRGREVVWNLLELVTGGIPPRQWLTERWRQLNGLPRSKSQASGDRVVAATGVARPARRTSSRSLPTPSREKTRAE